jgi:hypothetical protein
MLQVCSEGVHYGVSDIDANMIKLTSNSGKNIFEIPIDAMVN